MCLKTTLGGNRGDSLGELGGVLSLLPVNPSQCPFVQMTDTDVAFLLYCRSCSFAFLLYCRSCSCDRHDLYLPSIPASLQTGFCHMCSVRSTSDGRGPVTPKRVPDREEQGKPSMDARRGRCHPLEAGFWPLWMTPLPSNTITEYRIWSERGQRPGQAGAGLGTWAQWLTSQAGECCARRSRLREQRRGAGRTGVHRRQLRGAGQLQRERTRAGRLTGLKRSY